MATLDGEFVKAIVALVMIFGTGVTVAVSIVWLDHRTRVRALDVLRVYAERGEEPPASVVQALRRVGAHGSDAPPAPPTRADHLAHVAANVVFTLGAAGIIWWKAPDPHDPGRFVIFAIIAGLFFAAAAAARLVAAVNTKP